MIEEYNGIKVFDKAIFFAILACFLIFIRFDSPIFLNFSIGFSIGGSIFYYIIIFIQYKKIKRMAEESLEIAKKSQEELETKLEARYGKYRDGIKNEN